MKLGPCSCNATIVIINIQGPGIYVGMQPQGHIVIGMYRDIPGF